jgi:FKBP-type peptidyl-prolyl cis-trans isomerase
MKHHTVRRRVRWASVAIAAAMIGCSGSGDKAANTPSNAQQAAPPAAEPPAAAAQPAGPHDTITTPSGLRYVFLQHGSGPQAMPGQTVSVHYVGTLTSGKKFDSSRDRQQPFQFQLGAHRVIPGWDEGVALLHVGDRVVFIIPGNLAYGAGGAPPDIPPNATLIFDVELLGVQ